MMITGNPEIDATLSGLATNAIWSLACFTTKSLIKTAQTEEGNGNQDDLKSLVDAALDDLSEYIDISGPLKMEEVCIFLVSPECEALAKRMIATEILDGPTSISNDILQKMTALLATYFYRSIPDLEDQSKKLCLAMTKTLSVVIDSAINRGLLAAHEAQSSARYRILYDEIQALKCVGFGTEKDAQAKVSDIIDFEVEYRTLLGQVHGKITPPQFDGVKKIHIDNIFVAPTLEPSGSAPERNRPSISYPDFLRSSYRSVILGNPGSGKTTLTSKITFDLVNSYEARLTGNALLTPLHIILRDFSAEYKKTKCSIIEFLEIHSNGSFQLPPPRGAFDYLCNNGRALVILDGLDELLETSARIEMSVIIESFATRFPSVPILVTSRRVGYFQAPLDEKRFETYYVAPFDKNQVSEYVRNWFKVDTDLNQKQRDENIAAFMRESESAPDLRSNPLMLALMCTLYLGEGYIPRDRPNLYAKCADMMFERWDKSRGIKAPMQIEQHIRPALMHLAQWIYQNESLQSGVTETQLVGRTTDYLLKGKYDDRDEAEHAAREFVEFTRGRAWVFTETGKSRTDESIYQFSHRTFLEYFAAYDIVRNNETVDDLYETMVPKIRKREWDVVAQLSFQIKNTTTEDAGNKLLRRLVKESLEFSVTETAGWNMLSFAARCLEFIVPNRTIVREIVEACVTKSVEVGAKILGHNSNDDETIIGLVPKLEESGPAELMTTLLTIQGENDAPIVDTIVKAVSKVITSSNQVKKLSAGILLLEMRHPVTRHFGEEMAYRGGEVVNAVLKEVEYDLKKLSEDNFRIGTHLRMLGRVSLEECIQWWGLGSIFDSAGGLYSSFWYFPESMRIVRDIMEGNSEIVLVREIELLTKVILSESIPWRHADDFDHGPPFFDLEDLVSRPWMEIQKDRGNLLRGREFFVACTLLGFWFEISVKTAKGRNENIAVRKVRSVELGGIGEVLSARQTGAMSAATKSALSIAELDDPEHNFLTKWIAGELNLVGEGKRS